MAAATVFVASGAVLVLEILAVRLLAPYVGLTLETTTSIIGAVLAGTAGGAAVGGWIADRHEPRRLVVWLLIGRGLLALLTVPIVRALGPGARGHGDAAALGITLPRWLLATRPGSHAAVLEVDSRLVELVKKRMGLKAQPGLETIIGDGRITMRERRGGSADFVVGDAFSNYVVPWYLATREWLDEVKRVLKPGGLLLMAADRFTKPGQVDRTVWPNDGAVALPSARPPTSPIRCCRTERAVHQFNELVEAADDK